MATLLMLVSWEIWKERNARTFNNVATIAGAKHLGAKQLLIMPTIIFERIKSEARTWTVASAKHLGLFIARG
jgi:hypothetical protein